MIRRTHSAILRLSPRRSYWSRAWFRRRGLGFHPSGYEPVSDDVRALLALPQTSIGCPLYTPPRRGVGSRFRPTSTVSDVGPRPIACRHPFAVRRVPVPVRDRDVRRLDPPASQPRWDRSTLDARRPPGSREAFVSTVGPLTARLFLSSILGYIWTILVLEYWICIFLRAKYGAISWYK